VDDRIGRALREERQKQKLSLRSVATATGVSASLLSQVETGKSQPSVSTLYALVNHLGISLDKLLGIGVANTPQVIAADKSAEAGAGGRSNTAAVSRAGIQRGEDNPVLDMDNGVRWERLAVDDGDLVDPLLVTYQPGASSSLEGRLMRHSGVEYACLTEGELTLQLEFDTHVLRAGDSLCFQSSRPHLYYNHGKKVSRGIWFVVGRRSLDHTHQQLDLLLNRSWFGGDNARGPANAVEVLELLDRMRTVREEH
jgi:transcriptional regulator with XRE-family HTH domain